MAASLAFASRGARENIEDKATMNDKTNLTDAFMTPLRARPEDQAIIRPGCQGGVLPPQARTGRGASQAISIFSSGVFQSTRPWEDATCKRPQFCPHLSFQSTRPWEDATCRLRPCPGTPASFNPRVRGRTRQWQSLPVISSRSFNPRVRGRTRHMLELPGTA